jgi:hypothetical protein
MTALLMVSAAALTGCTGSSGPAPTPSQSTTSPSPSPSLTAAQQLQQLADLGAKAVYRATYQVRQKHPASRAVWRVWRTHNALRVDVVTKHVTATLIRTPRNTYACRRSGHHKTCFRIANGKPVPAPLRLLAERLFTGTLTLLAKASPVVTVTLLSTGPRLGNCFAVAPTHKNTVVEKAHYCLDPGGILTRVEYPNHNSVQITGVPDQKPTRQDFKPYSSPTPVPG